MAFGVGVKVLDGPVVEGFGVPRVEAGGVFERMEGTGEGGDGQTVVALAHLGAGTGRKLAGSFDVGPGWSVRPSGSVAFRVGVGLSF